MGFSARSRYGTRALVELALSNQDTPTRLSNLAENQDIPLRYLSKIAQDLKRAGLVRSVRGAHGGYLLARDPAKVRILDVVEALDGDLAPVDCIMEAGTCERSAHCAARELWSRVNDAVCGVLGDATLQDLVDRQVAIGRKPERSAK